LIVTHSNTALNQLFEKIMALDVQERHLLRLGRGEEDLKTEKDMSRYGRVDFILGERLELLKRVERLAVTVGTSADVAATCETSGHFYVAHVEPRWEAYTRTTAKKDVEAVASAFPFTDFFADAPQPLFKGVSFEEDMETAVGCKHYIDDIFTQLKEYRAFEILHRGRDRSNYLLVKEAKIIAMTCTHAAITRSDLVELGFKYDNVLMEESAQILEVETFIPLLLQNPEDGRNRLKRVTLIGDHHQLPPVIKNMAFKKFSNMEQSLFTRFIRLGVPAVQLDAQGRSRASLSKLYSWNYEGLGNLSHTLTNGEFKIANPGLRHEFQMINVEDYQGRGEHCPELHFFQNLGEAEYAIQTFMFLRLKGVPANKITLLTTYNGQKALLRDVVNRNCASNPLFGMPNAIETVDKYQGSQNNYIILSLVRTLHVGHLRDVRRLIVAMSRARLGLYVFCRVSLFKQCHEIKPVLDVLLDRPTKLELYPSETGSTDRLVGDTAAAPVVVKDMPMMASIVRELAKEKLGMGAANLDQFIISPTLVAVPEKLTVAPEAEKVADPADAPAPMESEQATDEAVKTSPEKLKAVQKKAAGSKRKRGGQAEAVVEQSGPDEDQTEVVDMAVDKAEVEAPAKKSTKKAKTAKTTAEEPAGDVQGTQPAKPSKKEAATDFSKLTVAKLKTELKKYGLPTDGKKAELSKRLTGHLASEM
jgi:intron-binding protein aquarius